MEQRRLPPPGEFAAFNRSHYVDLLMVLLAYAVALTRCSSVGAPWFAVPANRKWLWNWAVSKLPTEGMEEMKLTCSNPHVDVCALKKTPQAVV